jgi:CDP-diacylglycerol---glycerol-3-phosphate 3-phosphatidyltransferase
MTGVPASATGSHHRAAAAARPAGLWNIANILTMARLVLVPGFVLLMFHNGGYDPAWRAYAWAAFAIAMITDLFDGHLARRYNLVTDFGKIADPIADKALTGMAFVALSVIGELWWWVTVLVLVREWGITLLRFWVIRHGVIAASSGGKLKTVLQTVALGLFVLPLKLLENQPWHTVGLVLWWAAVALMTAAVTVTLVTGVDYVVKALAVRRAGRARVRTR